MIQIIALRGAGTCYPTGSRLLIKSLESVFTEGAEILKEIPEEERVNLFYTLASHSGAETSSKPVRTSKTFLSQEAVAFDIDKIDTSPALQEAYIQAVCAVLGVQPDSITIVNSGNGLHFILFLQTFIKEVAFFTAYKPYYNEICARINFKLAEAELPGSADPAIFEPARILRLPGTRNVKPNRADTECVLLSSGQARLSFDFKEISGLGDLATENVSLQEVKRNYPNPDLPEILSERGCPFVRWAFEKPQELHEPQAFDYFSILAQISEGTEVLCNGKPRTPRQLAEYAYENATSSASLARGHFENKWNQAIRYGVRKCDTIASRWEGCALCPHFSKIKTPLALKSDAHIATAAQGYWCMNARGDYTHPAYGDLQRAFSKETGYVVDGERIFAFDGKKYTEVSTRFVKAWVESTVDPSDPLMERHCIEATGKIVRSNVLSIENKEHLFEGSIRGKINLANGIYDVRSGEFHEHSPRYGFKYVLPYAYDPAAMSEFFYDWLAKVMINRTELIESVLDFLGYCLWNGYDDHVFMYLIGEGANGKSTLINIMKAVIGVSNFSSVNMTQLTQNRFASAHLEGKLVNLCEEANGKELTSEHLNIIKVLSSGGEFTAERKGQDGFVLKNTAKLLFSANEAPRFMEHTAAIKRRMLVIPCDYSIKELDPGVEERLISEVPGIFSMLVKRIQDNVKENKKRYKVSRGGHDALEAQKKLLHKGDPVMAWANEFLEQELSIDAYIPTDEAYAHYNQWCDESGIKFKKDKIVFSKIVGAEVCLIKKSNLIRINGKVKRVLWGIKWV